jgi:hypothetical protein
MLLHTCVTHQVSNGLVDELFSLLYNFIFPRPNHMPGSNYEATKTLLQKWGAVH